MTDRLVLKLLGKATCSGFRRQHLKHETGLIQSVFKLIGRVTQPRGSRGCTPLASHSDGKARVFMMLMNVTVLEKGFVRRGNTSVGKTQANERASMFRTKADPARRREDAEVLFQFVDDKDDGSLELE